MAVSMQCADLTGTCPAVFTTDTEEELLEHVALHAQRAHPEVELTPQVVEQVQGLVRTV